MVNTLDELASISEHGSYADTSKGEEFVKTDDEYDDTDVDEVEGSVSESSSSRAKTKFDVLCEGVVTGLAHVHDGMVSLMTFKDELLEHALPPSVLVGLTLSTAETFRSVSDLQTPLSELVRLVRLYSAPWEKKSLALKRLHDDYEQKKRLLNIAIHRLQLVESQSKRMHADRMLSNWEKLFTRLCVRKGHGRRWKFMIETFKKKSALGFEHLNAYLESLEEREEEETDEEKIQKKLALLRMKRESQRSASGQTRLGSSKPGSAGSLLPPPLVQRPLSGNLEVGLQEPASSGRSSSTASRWSPDDPTKEVKNGVGGGGGDIPPGRGTSAQAYQRPLMEDKEVWTHEPEFDRFLHVRVFHPMGLQGFTNVKCYITYGGKFFKTGILDPPPLVDRDSESANLEKQKSMKGGLMGSKGRGATKEDAKQTKGTKKKKSSQAGVQMQQIDLSRFEECFFKLPHDLMRAGAGVRRGSAGSDPALAQSADKTLRITVHYGPLEEVVAILTMHLNDLEALNFPMFLTSELPPSRRPESSSTSGSGSFGSAVGAPESTSSAVPTQHHVTFAPSLTKDSGQDGASEGTPASEDGDQEEQEPAMSSTTKVTTNESSSVDVDDVTNSLRPMSFPLYGIHAGEITYKGMPKGSLPLVVYFSQRLRPFTQTQETSTEALEDLIFQMTGIDISASPAPPVVLCDRACSVASFPEEELRTQTVATGDSIPREDHDLQLQQLRQEMSQMRAEYEEQLTALSRKLQQAVENAGFQEGGADGSGFSRTSSAGGSARPTTTVGSRTGYTAGTMMSYDMATKPLRCFACRALKQPKSFMQLETPSWKKFRRVKTLPIWGENLPKSFLTRLTLFMEAASTQREELVAKVTSDVEDVLTRQLAALHHLAKQNGGDGRFEAKGVSGLEAARQTAGQDYDICLPAVFMPSRIGHVYHPGASNYFHPTGISGAGQRVGQPPTLLNLPPLKLNKDYTPVLNLFDLSRQNLLRDGPTWLRAPQQSRSVKQREPVRRSGDIREDKTTETRPNLDYISSQVENYHLISSFRSASPSASFPHDIPAAPCPDPTYTDDSTSQSYGALNHPNLPFNPFNPTNPFDAETVVDIDDVYNEGGFSLESHDLKMPHQ